MDVYICPMCKQENGEHQKYCLNCGTWLLNPTFPAKKKGSSIKKNSKKVGTSIFALVVIAVVLWFGFGEISSSNKIVFDDVKIGDQFSLSQLVVSKSSISADFTTVEATTTPLEIAAVFYDRNGTRLGMATTTIQHQLAAGQTTTIQLEAKESIDIKAVKDARIEVKPLSPLMMLEKLK